MASTQQTQFETPDLPNHFYQPNFILIKDRPAFFGDILPVYRSYQELNTVIVSSWESLAKLVWHCRAFLLCISSFLSESLHNVAYQTILTVSAVVEHTSSLPEKYSNLSQKISHFLEIIKIPETRSLWWLDLKLEVKRLLKDLGALVNNFFKVISKLYLVSLVSIILLVVSSPTIGSASNKEFFSVLGKALDNHSTYSNLTRSSTGAVSVLGLLQQEGKSSDNLIFQKITEHKVQAGESVEIIAEMYGLSPETVVFNNQLKDGEALPASLFLPWSDGYIYKVESDISPEEIERIYGVDKNEIYFQNEDSLNREKNLFSKDSFILIPTTNFGDIANSNLKEAERKDNLKRAEEQKKVQTEAVARSNRQTFANTFTEANNAGFIWPTQGSISRCVQASHVACDIANGSMPPIFSVQRGTVSAVYRFTVAGYGLAVVIDHGNGLKTLYAHMSEIYVEQGQQLIQGQSIGRMGCTGYCTGTHLHFEVIANGVKQNPLNYLP